GLGTPNAPVVMSFVSTGYEHVQAVTNNNSDFSKGFSMIMTNRDLFLGIPIPPGLPGDLATLSVVNNQIQSIDQVYQTYGYTGDPQLSANASQVTSDINSLSFLINEIDTDPTQSYSAQSYVSLSYGSPQLNFDLTTSPAWGGGGGVEFADITDESIGGAYIL